jgi:hypothetical protein
MARGAARFVLKGDLITKKKKELTGGRLQTKNGEKRRRKDENGEERERDALFLLLRFSIIFSIVSKKLKSQHKILFFIKSNVAKPRQHPRQFRTISLESIRDP